ncbi:MAG: SapC family protein [Magnetococcales bacterium]|nr:SapC family protein [Magnetococcales bacterium]
MPQVMFYDRPEPLNKERHRALKLDAKRADPGFASKTNSVPLAGMEFHHAAKEFPIVFLQVGDGAVLAAALLGVRTDENLYMGDDGRWSSTYVPAFVRRYPFILAENPAQPDQWTVCLDVAFPGFNTETGDALFGEDGEPTPLMSNTIRFLQEYQEGFRRTALFIERLQKLELLTPMTAQVETAGGQKFALQGLMTVDEQKLLALEESQAMELFRSGELGWIYAHLISLGNINRLASLLSTRNQA